MAYLKLSEKPKVFIDTEGTGLDPIVNEPLEFAGIKGDETLVVKIKPRRIHTATPKAMEVNGYNEAEWADAEDISTAAPKIAAFLKDCVIIGHNVRFDTDFLEQFFREAGFNQRLGYHTGDTTTLALFHLVPLGLESLSLKPVCEFLGIPPEPAVHRALAGATACKAIYEAMQARARFTP